MRTVPKAVPKAVLHVSQGSNIFKREFLFSHVPECGVGHVAMEISTEETIRLLKNSELFTSLDEAALINFAAHAEYRQFNEEEKVFASGAGQGTLYIVKSGRIAIAREGGEGKLKVFASFISGESFGELDLLSFSPSDSLAFAEEESVLLRFPRADTDIESFLHSHPRAGAILLHNLLTLVARRIRSTNSLISERTPWIQELRNQVLLDKLTGLYNNTYLKEDFPKLLASEAEGTSILVIKPDNFKLINDQFGHDAGDKTLCLMAKTLQQKLETVEVALRYKGDVFAAVMPKASIDEAKERAETIRLTYEKLDLSAVLGDSSVGLNVSIGIARYPEQSRDAEEMVKSAYDLMFEAREAGGNEIKTSEPSIHV